MSPRLLAVDLDGTLLDAEGEPHDEDVRAIEELRLSGIEVTIITGRLYSGTRGTASRLGLTGPVGCVDGSHVVNASSHCTMMHHGIEGEDAATLRDCVAFGSPATFVFARDRILHDARGIPYLGYVTLWSGDLLAAEDIFEHSAWDHPEGITSVVAVGTVREITHAAEETTRRLAGKVQVATFPVHRLGTSWGMVIRCATGDKGTALSWIASHHGCPLEETVCVGDWLNDVPMFRVAGRSYAMGQAPDEVKLAASITLTETSTSGGGIARVAKEIWGI